MLSDSSPRRKSTLLNLRAFKSVLFSPQWQDDPMTPTFRRGSVHALDPNPETHSPAQSPWGRILLYVERPTVQCHRDRDSVARCSRDGELQRPYTVVVADGSFVLRARSTGAPRTFWEFQLGALEDHTPAYALHTQILFIQILWCVNRYINRRELGYDKMDKSSTRALTTPRKERGDFDCRVPRRA